PAGRTTSAARRLRGGALPLFLQIEPHRAAFRNHGFMLWAFPMRMVLPKVRTRHGLVIVRCNGEITLAGAEPLKADSVDGDGSAFGLPQRSGRVAETEYVRLAIENHRPFRHPEHIGKTGR